MTFLPGAAGWSFVATQIPVAVYALSVYCVHRLVCAVGLGGSLGRGHPRPWRVWSLLGETSPLMGAGQGREVAKEEEDGTQRRSPGRE